MQRKSSLLTVHPLYNNHRNWTVGTYYFNFYDNNINWKERECKLLFIYALLPHPHILYSKETVGCCLFPKELIQLDFSAASGNWCTPSSDDCYSLCPCICGFGIVHISIIGSNYINLFVLYLYFPILLWLPIFQHLSYWVIQTIKVFSLGWCV